MIWEAIPVIGKVVEKIVGIIDKAVPDKDLAAKLKADFEAQLAQQDFSLIQAEIQAQASIIASEAQGASWLQRNWRPILMLVIVAIIGNNYIVFPYVNLFFPGKAVMLQLPDMLWSLMQIGVGGYIMGRSVEKGVQAWKGNGNG